MKNIIEQRTSFNNLSVKDLLEARDLFHVHLMSKVNVVGTAIGRYRIRQENVKDGKIFIDHKTPVKSERTLSNSMIVDESWPCILVFVEKWLHESDFRKGDYNQAIPKNIYMPDGRIVPICVVAAPVEEQSDILVDETKLQFPDSAIGGGYPLIIDSQGIKKIASIGCIVTDGNKYYALTNKHVLGSTGDIIYTRLRDELFEAGTSSGISIGNTKFQTVYHDWMQENLFINVDAGLIEINDINKWKTDIFGLGRLGKVVDLHSKNISLKLIGLDVSAFGAVSGKLEGEIAALFYRYKSIGGYDYIADFLIGPKDGQETLPTKHGDSGTVWTIERADEEGKIEYLPVAMQWGQRSISKPGGVTGPIGFALATNLSHVCRDLGVDIVRDWNLDLDFTWGKKGHFKIGFGAYLVVVNVKLKELLEKNAGNIGIRDADLISGNVAPGMFSDAFVPMADVADMYWRTKRPKDSSNHFADMDDQHAEVYENKTLLDLCFDSHGNVNADFLDVDKWLDYYSQLDEKKPELDGSGRTRKRLGGLPFRVWQMYNEMVDVLKGNDKDEIKLQKFVCAGGTMSHYVGDACQPLHISSLHDGYPDGRGKDVHSAYETKMLDAYIKKPQERFLEKTNEKITALNPNELFTGGKNAARAVLELMWKTYHLMPPKDIVDVFIRNRSVKDLYDNFGPDTQQTIANGIHTMGIIWQSAWEEGRGDTLTAQLIEISQQDLMKLYKDLDFVPSYRLNDPKLKDKLR
ncbi:hypothetical protein FMM05_20595 [Flavobacterium zepuense]|uniref:Nal1 C-terminal domain-containing protein n=1 Tax=Flavobacterium zepuense TaxID=2593302 RepID=A0A552USF8_9FLAO|nr:hypothetical protein [Flavobacterium zepuense]TRW21090.1 hypothetical protein FMM05_20595 [Flavobacterium zepuense]